MNAKPIRAAAVLLLVATLAWAGGGQIGSITWTTGYPKGDDNGTIAGQGAFSYPTGWTGGGNMYAYLSAGGDEFFAYVAPMMLATEDGSTGTWSAGLSDLPPGTYTVMCEAVISNGTGTEYVLSEIESATVGGDKKKVDPGKLEFTTGPTGTKNTISAVGNCQANKDFAVKLDGFSAKAVPVTAFGKLDKTRKEVMGKVEYNAVNKEFKATIDNVPAGRYEFQFLATFTEIADITKTHMKSLKKTITVSN